MEEKSILKAKRLQLRNLEISDADIMYVYRNDSACNKYQRYENTSKEYLNGFVARFLHSKLLPEETEQHYALALNESGTMIGDVSVFFTKKDNCFTLGITVAPQFQGCGYAYEILSELTAFLQKSYPTTDIVALVERDNFKSAALFEKLGFIKECYAEAVGSYVFVIYGNKEE